MADKDSYPRLLCGDIFFRRIDPFPGEIAPPVVKEFTNLGAGAAGGEDRLGDIDGTLESAADKDPGFVGLHGIDRIELGKIVRFKFNAVGFSNALYIFRRVHTDGQYHHIEFFLFYSFVEGGISYRDILRYWVLFYYGCVASEEPDTGKFLCSFVESLKILPVGPDIIVEYGTFGLCVMIFCQNHVFLGVGTAYGRTVTVAAFDDLPGADALDPGYVMGMLLV